MKKRTRKPDPAAGTFAVCLGGLGLVMVIFYPHQASESSGTRYYLSAFSISLLGWGINEITAAKKQKHEPGGTGGSEEQEATNFGLEDKRLEKLEKSGSLENVVVLLAWVFVLIVAVALIGCFYLFLFHHR